MSYMQSFPRPTPTYHTTTYDRLSKRHAFSGSGKTILVTGGASGVGLSISKAFAAAGAARIVIVSRSASQQEAAKNELEAMYPSVHISTYTAPIADQVRMNEVMEDAGDVDVLVLNAAIAHRRAAASDLTDQEVHDAFDTNTFAAFDMARSFLKMKDDGSNVGTTPLKSSDSPVRQRTVIYISAAAAHMTNPYRAAYSASKAAAVILLQSLAAQYSAIPSSGVKIVSLHPGSIYTPGVAANMPRDMPGVLWDDPFLAADFTVWLAGEESDFLHGKHIWANWDVDELISLKGKMEVNPNLLTIGLVQ